MPRMTRKQALARLQAVCDKKGWRLGILLHWKDTRKWTFGYIKGCSLCSVQNSTLTALVAAFERLAQ